jgi:hypothetical protein
MRNAFAIAFFVMKMLFRQKLTPVFAFGAIFALVVAIGISSVDIGVRFKLLSDLLLVSSAFILHASLFFYAFTLMQKHREGGLFLLFLTNGAKRWEYILGLFYALAFVAIFIALCMLAGSEAIYLFVSGGSNPAFAFAILLQMCSSILAAYLLVTLSHFVSGVSSAIYTLVLLLIGFALPEAYLYFGSAGYLGFALHSLYYILPNFSFFEASTLVSNDIKTDWVFKTLFAYIYFKLYASALFFVTVKRFTKEGLKVG